MHTLWVQAQDARAVPHGVHVVALPSWPYLLQAYAVSSSCLFSPMMQRGPHPSPAALAAGAASQQPALLLSFIA